jgi:Tfp pilus assembly protein FimT
MNNFYQKGITAFELIIVFAILGIILTITIPQFAKTREQQVVKAAVQDVLSSIDRARSDSLSSLDSSEYGVHFESDQIIIFKGMVFSAGAGDNIIVSITSPATISSVTFGGVSASSGDVYFNRLSGAPSTTGTITISSPNYSKIITILPTGVASVN